MSTTIISEGKTTTEAIEAGLKKLKVPRSHVEIKVLENEDKRSFFSILAPRVVKVELTVKEEVNTKQKDVVQKNIVPLTEEEYKQASEKINTFLEKFLPLLSDGIKYNIEKDEIGVKVELHQENLGYLIGYRGETLYALQTILSSIANKGINKKVRVLLDIENYKEKRIKTLEELAEKVAHQVIKTKKSRTLEPMQAYERKIIHSKLQEYSNITTKSIGEEPRRRIVISLK